MQTWLILTQIYTFCKNSWQLVKYPLINALSKLYVKQWMMHIQITDIVYILPFVFMTAICLAYDFHKHKIQFAKSTHYNISAI